MEFKKHITFKNMEKSEVMQNYANEKLAHIEDFLSHEPTPIFIELVLEASKTREHPKIELRIKTPHYDEFVGTEHDGTPFYDALDNVLDIMYRRLVDKKERLVDEKKWVGRHEEFKKQR